MLIHYLRRSWLIVLLGLIAAIPIRSIHASSTFWADLSISEPAFHNPNLVIGALSPCTNAALGLSVSPCDPASIPVHTGTVDTIPVLLVNSGFSPQSITVSTTCVGRVAICSTIPSSFVISGTSVDTLRVVLVIGMTPGPGTAIVTLGGMTTVISVTASMPQDFVLDTTKTFLTDRQLSLCALGCFSAATSVSTVPFYTLDTPRSVLLLYNEDRVHPRPIVTADVAPVLSGAAPTQYQLEATLNGAAITFANGDTKTYFTGSSSAVRLANQFDASGYATGVYTLAVTVTAIYTGGITKSHTYSRPLVVVNELANATHLPAGWTIGGIERLYQTGTSYLITNGAGDAVYYSALNTKGDDYTTLTQLPGGSYVQTALDSTRTYFHVLGPVDSVVDRLGRRTRYFYTGSQLDSIQDPQRVARGSGTHLQFTYTGGVLSAITEVGGGGRSTVFTHNPDLTLASVTDPDGLSTQFGYDSVGRFATLIDRRGDTTHYQYASTWKVKEIDLPRIAVDAGGGNTVLTVPKTTFTSWMSASVPSVATTSGSPATPATQNTITGTVTDAIGRTMTLKVNRWGESTFMSSSALDTTNITYDGLLPTVVTESNGLIDSVVYVPNTPLVSRTRIVGDSAVNYHHGIFSQVDSTWGPGLPTQINALNPSNGRVDSSWVNHVSRKTRYTYDAMNRVLSVTDPGNHVRQSRYDAVTGNVDTTIAPGQLYEIRQFDAFGRVITDSTTGRSPAIVSTYDTLNRPVAVWHRGVAHDSTVYTYDALYVTNIRTPGEQNHAYEVNALGWVTKAYDVGNPSLFMSYRYDTAGRLTSYTNRRGQRIDKTYDALDRLTQQSGPSLPTDQFSYLNNGRVVTAWRPNVSRDSAYLSATGEPDSLVRKIAGHRYAFL